MQGAFRLGSSLHRPTATASASTGTRLLRCMLNLTRARLKVAWCGCLLPVYLPRRLALHSSTLIASYRQVGRVGKMLIVETEYSFGATPTSDSPTFP